MLHRLPSLLPRRPPPRLPSPRPERQRSPMSDITHAVQDEVAPAKPYSYDLVPYESQPFSQSEPDQVAAMARLFGLSPVPPEKARVLELGCSAGGNIIPLAARYPGMQVTGIELSRVEVDQGLEVIKGLGLTNITIRQADILDVLKEENQYDYIIAHGVFSWVPEVVQEAILQICGRQLSGDGVAYISYNVYPGWKMREVIREMMLFHAGNLTDPKVKLQQGRAILDYARKINNGDSAFGKLLAQEAELVMKANDYYLFHDHMEENNRPCYFKDFAARSSKYGVVYLGEASLVDMAPQRFGGDIAQTLAMLSNGNILATEQYMDMFTNRMFRQTLLVKEALMPRINRAVSDKSVRHLHFTSELSRGTALDGALGVFNDRQGRVLTVREPVMLAVADALIQHAPFTTSVEDVLALLRSRGVAAERSDEALIEAIGAQFITLLLQGMVKTRYSRKTAVPVSDKPVAFGPARFAAAKGQRVVPNTFHGISALNDVQSALLAKMDGTNTVSEVEASLLARFTQGEFNASRDGSVITDPPVVADVVKNVTANALADFSRGGLLAA
ncbi:MAG: methyltransferase domain-containing protein [Comamonadaceae bacterium]|nr:MAG: methyltransferase domain-containing protein [Comamonadaceae bacterium]